MGRGAGIPAGKLSSLKESKSGKENLNSGISQFTAGDEDFNVQFMCGGISQLSLPGRKSKYNKYCFTMWCFP